MKLSMDHSCRELQSGLSLICWTFPNIVLMEPTWNSKLNNPRQLLYTCQESSLKETNDRIISDLL
jgi:hypothetical protein